MAKRPGKERARPKAARANGKAWNLDPDSRLQRIYATIDSVPRGSVATYGQIAREAQLAGRARLVGRALRLLPAGSQLPWHRIINSSGRSSLAGKSAREQHRRLRAEGVLVAAGGRIDLARFAWRPRSAHRDLQG